MKIKTLPHWILFFKLLTKDYDNTEKTYQNVLDELFIKSTGVYKVMIMSLKKLSIKITSKVELEVFNSLVENKIIVFEVLEKNNHFLIINTKTNDSFSIPINLNPESIIQKIGYSLID